MMVCLLDDELYGNFKNRCKKAWCIEEVMFLRAVLEFQTISSTYGLSKQSADKAKEICETHILQGAVLEINLDMAIVENINFKVKENSFEVEIFDEAFNSVSQTLRHGVFREWSSEPNFNGLIDAAAAAITMA